MDGRAENRAHRPVSAHDDNLLRVHRYGRARIVLDDMAADSLSTKLPSSGRSFRRIRPAATIRSTSNAREVTRKLGWIVHKLSRIPIVKELLI
jgi:hypothetical protein